VQEALGMIEDDGLKELWQDAISEFMRTGDVKSLLSAAKWRWPVVPLDEFLFAKFYLGQRPAEVYPGVLDALHDLDTDKYDEAILKGALGIGKSTLANLATARDLYKLSCMANPHQVYGISTGSPIVFTMQSVRLATARKVVFNEFGRYVRNSAYFQTKFPFDKNITSEMIFPEHNISLMPVSSSGTAVISMNVIGGQLDEVNFMDKNTKSKSSQADADGNFDQAKNLHNTLANRRKSRFLHREDLPGALFVISSSRFPDDFTEKKAAEATMQGGEDDRIYVFGGSQWAIKGRDVFDKEEFTVQIGNETFPSKVIARNPETNEDLEKVAPGTDFIKVPMNLHREFVQDVEGSIRDFAGLTTQSTTPFFTQRHMIARANELAAEYGYNNPMPLESVVMVDVDRLPNLDMRYLRTDVDASRHCHIDLSLRRDACGFAVGHTAGWRVTKDPGSDNVTIYPVIAYDILLQIKPPQGGEIELAAIRAFLKLLRDTYGLPIDTVTFDQFQSADSRQILKKANFAAGYLSVDDIEPYRTYRDALYQERILQYRHAVCNRELAQVERTMVGKKEKVDHRPNGSKDVADAAVGVATFLLTRKSNWRANSAVGSEPGLYMIGAKTKPTTGNADADAIFEEARQLKRKAGTRRRLVRKAVGSRK